MVITFLESYYKAGLKEYSFAYKNSSEALRANLENILEFLNKTPLAVLGSDTRSPEIITYSDILRYIKQSVYKPIKYFLKLADVLTNISLRDGSLLIDIKHAEEVLIYLIENR